MSRTTNTTSSTRTFQSPKVPVEEPKISRKKPAIITQGIRINPWFVVLAFAILSIFMYVQYQQATTKLQKSAPAAASRQIDTVVARVGKLIILPSDEKPSTLATVADASKLKDQSFFANAKDGDKVLVYSKQKRAILYRPSTNQLVNVAAVTLSSTDQTTLTPAH